MGALEATFRIIGALAALAFVLFLAWLLLRFVNKRVPGMGGGSAGRLINVLDRVSAGKNSTIILVRVEDKVFLLAISEHAIEKLHEFDDPDGLIKIPETAQNVSFSSALKDAMGKVGGRNKDDGSGKGDKK